MIVGAFFVCLINANSTNSKYPINAPCGALAFKKIPDDDQKIWLRKLAQGRLSVDSSTLTNQNILVQRIVCRRKVLPLQHGKETFFIRL